MKIAGKEQTGFTIVELLIVIVVIAILAAISIVAYNGIQNRSKNVTTQQSLSQVAKLVEAYNALKGSYPSTGSLNNVYTDSGCPFSADGTGGFETAQWVPNISEVSTSPLPQGDFAGVGRDGLGGCFTYASDGTSYILSAWNAKYGGPSTDAMYRRLGFREQSWFYDNAYICNHPGNIGGISGTTYLGSQYDFYKYSYTISNISNCNETPPSGA